MQVNHFIRRHSFLQTSLVCHTTSERRSFERDIYDYARGLGLSTSEAHKEVLKGRAFCGEEDYNSDNTALGDEVDDSAETMKRLATPIVSARKRSGSGQLVDVPAVVEEPRQRRRRKKQSVGEPLGKVKAQVDAMDIEASAMQREPSDASQQGGKSSKGISSKFFPTGRETSEKRRRESADEANLQAKKKPKKEAKIPKLKKVDGQAPANGEIDQGVSTAHAVSNPESHSKGEESGADTHLATGNGVEEKKDAGTMGDEGEGTANSKNQEKKKKQKDKSKEPEATTTAEATNVAESAGNVVAADEGSEANGPAIAESMTDQAVNGPLQEQQSSVTARSVMPSDEGSDHLSDSKAVKAARKLRKQERRRAVKIKAKNKTETQDGAANLPPEAKLTTPNESCENFDSRPINQITGLSAPSINELIGIPGPSNEHGPGNTARAISHDPNDPKSAAEARHNLFISAERDSNQHGITANINDEPQFEQMKKPLDSVEHLDALKDFSNRKQVELFDQGQFKHADKQTKDDLKEIKNDLQLEKKVEEHQSDVEHAKKKRRRKRKSGAIKKHTANDDSVEDVKTKKAEQTKSEVDPTPRHPGFQSPMIQ